ncbi:hypothetical protein LEP1GSC084_1068 [Leptospira interrogans serovar Medanensis str. L0448]|uniref:hypothetical protein n=1 Tax=Leptospira interrogans TaxID=173 RepID=UPI00029826CB|nr:hypothetical protein [Leptospira interrogans]EKR82552.1 hypothetical protein LEP1GSC099_1441 [Leptospira interrogans str. UI 08452]EMN33213.1 hypothetical protein LEP1GSC084_1068 [Leptospira interrogans serovar Medanensis str. L0448]EMN38369.1 hypothetical protein LEP1GSC085_0035 [Leptospira interrogans str. L0996]
MKTATIEIKESYKSQRLPVYAKDRDGRQLPTHINLNQHGEVFASHAEKVGYCGMERADLLQRDWTKKNKI